MQSLRKGTIAILFIISAGIAQAGTKIQLVEPIEALKNVQEHIGTLPKIYSMTGEVMSLTKIAWDKLTFHHDPIAKNASSFDLEQYVEFPHKFSPTDRIEVFARNGEKPNIMRSAGYAPNSIQALPLKQIMLLKDVLGHLQEGMQQYAAGQRWDHPIFNAANKKWEPVSLTVCWSRAHHDNSTEASEPRAVARLSGSHTRDAEIDAVTGKWIQFRQHGKVQIPQ